jgi:hypothetical protein
VRKLDNWELHSVYSSANVITMIIMKEEERVGAFGMLGRVYKCEKFWLEYLKKDGI